MRVIITGSEGLIGQGISDMFEQDGYEVVRCDLSLGHDLTDEEFVIKFFEENKSPYLLNLFGLNSVVDENNLFDITLDSFRKYLETNLTALFSVCREYSRNNETGAIVNVSSLYSINSPDPELYKEYKGDKKQKHIAYGISKAGVEQMTRHLGVHLAPNIRVNCVAPGGVEAEGINESFKTKFRKKVPLNRQQKVEELYGIFKFLCSEQSSYATCETFRINGGYGVS